MRAWPAAVLLSLTMLAGCLDDDPDLSRSPEPETNAIRFGAAQVVDAAEAVATEATPYYVYTGYTGAEPNMGITREGNIFATAFDKTIRSQDGGWTWESVQDYNPILGLVERGTSDPMMWVDPVTDRIFVNHMVSLWCFTMTWSDDEGADWFIRDLACPLPGVDHQKVASGPYGPDSLFDRGTGATPVPYNPVYPTVLYTCYNNVLNVVATATTTGSTHCFMSYDGGITYPIERPVMTRVQDGCGGINGHPAFHPDGTVVVPAAYACGRPVIAVSSDSGLTWDVRDGPSTVGTGASIDPDAAFDAAGNLYFIWRGADHLTYVVRSNDLGQSWDGPWSITPPDVTATRFHVATAGDEGRVGFGFLGTKYVAAEGESWGGAPHDAPANATWHLYMVTTDDGDADAPTFTAYQVTPDEDPVQKGCAWEGGGGGGSRVCRNMLDFIDSAVHPDGTFYVTYTEGCTHRNECAFNHTDMDELDARDREVAMAFLTGWSLWDKPGHVPAGRSALDHPPPA